MVERAASHEKVNGVDDVGAFSRASAADYDDPMSKVLGLDAQTSTLGAWFGFGGGGTALAVALMALVSLVAWMHATQRLAGDRPEEIEVEEAPPPPPPPVAEPTPEPKPAAAPPPRAAPHEAPPPPAQAAKVLAQEPDPNEPVDLTANAFVQGSGDTYAGGYTTASGTGKSAARAAPGPAPAPPPPQAAAPAPPRPDLSRPASLAGGSQWSCPFPPEADTAQVDEAFVTLQVDVRADGTPSAARILGDPGNGFGREARRCAMNKRYSTALDHDGNPIPGTTKVFRVHFSR